MKMDMQVLVELPSKKKVVGGGGGESRRNKDACFSDADDGVSSEILGMFC